MTYHEHGFIRYQQVNKESAGKDVPVSHAKVFYQIAYTDRSELNEYIRLDVLYEDTHYKKVNCLSLENTFVKWDGEPVKVNVPSVDDILGDKLTAFAPNTSGIPYFKNGKNRNLEIIKQLYDVGRLFDAATDLDCVKTAYDRIVPVEMSYRNLPADPSLALDDAIATAKCLATRGKSGNGDFEALQNGINRLKSFMYLGKYYIEQASRDAAKAAYLAAVIKHNLPAFEKYDNRKPLLKTEKKLPAIISKTLMLMPEAYFYWVKYAEIEDF